MKYPKLTAAAVLLAGAALVAGPLTAASSATAVSGKSAPSVRPLSTVVGTGVSVAPGGHGLATATCPAGKIVSGGGGATSAFDIEFTDSTVSGNGWLIRGTNHGTSTQTLTATAVCLGLS